MTQRALLVSVVAASAALVLAASGSPSSAKVVELQVNDGFTVKNTHVVCAVETSKVLIPGVKVVGCEFANRQGAVPKTYEAALGVDGQVALARVRAGSPPLVVDHRKPSVLGARAPRLYYLVSGDSITVKGTAIICATAGKKSGTKNSIAVTCFKRDQSTGKARPNSYGIGITDGGAFIVHFDAKSKATPVKIVAHGK
jgi:hypothetical protein